MVAIAIGLAAAGQDDEDYDEAPEWEKQNFWILPDGIRLPRDQVFGKLIGHTIEKVADQLFKGEFKDQNVLEIGGTLLKDIITNFTPDKVSPELLNLAIGYFGNYDMFRERAIVPDYMADKIGYMQRDIATSNLAAHLSEALYDITKPLPFFPTVNIGAKKVDWALKRHITNMTTYLTNVYDLGY